MRFSTSVWSMDLPDVQFIFAGTGPLEETREDFLNYNELYSKRIEEYDRKINELEAEQQNLQTAPNAYPFLDVYRKYRKLEEITRPMVVELIEKIEVYEGNRVEITFRFHDEIADLLEELHQKQMGQNEVSA